MQDTLKSPLIRGQLQKVNDPPAQKMLFQISHIRLLQCKKSISDLSNMNSQ